jgi:hypothetical protein
MTFGDDVIVADTVAHHKGSSRARRDFRHTHIYECINGEILSSILTVNIVIAMTNLNSPWHRQGRSSSASFLLSSGCERQRDKYREYQPSIPFSSSCGALDSPE